MNLKQITPDRSTNSRLLVHEAAGGKLLIKVFLGDNKEQRKELEAKKLTCWKAEGFCVPHLIDLQIPEVTEPHIVMEFISGDTLKDFLKVEAKEPDRRLTALANLFRLNYRRHMLARSRQNMLLIHTDPNTDNIIVSGSDFYFIDFEHSSKITDIASAVANEVGTLARRIIRDLGTERTRSVIESLLVAYHCDREIFDKIEHMTFGRPFQPLHRIKDHLRRLMNSRSVTRYDVADSIKALRSSSTKAQPPE